MGSNFLCRKLFLPFTILITNRCNSQCLICNIWKKKTKVDLSVKTVRKILNDKIVKHQTFFVLTGGEPLLHPDYKEILALFRGRNYVLLTNALLVDRVVEAVRELGVKRLSISLDGPRETYKKVRGVDGFPNVEKVIRELKDEAKIRIDYTINPWNSKKDLIYVMNFCRKYGVELGAGYYTATEYFEVTQPPGHLYDVSDLFDHPYYRLYHEWVNGNLKMPCVNIFGRPSIRPDGNVMLCEQKEIVLGNLYEESLEEIWSSKETLAIQRKYFSCNECWSDCNRFYDLEIFSYLKSFVPARWVQAAIPNYDWTKIYNNLS